MSISQPHILLITDDSNDRQRLHILLDPLGGRISVATSGTDAINIFQSDVVDLVITDINIGSFDVWRLTRIIRSGIYPSSKETPIIIVTHTWCERITEITAREFGVNQLLPFDDCHKLPDIVKLLLKSPSTGLKKHRLLVIEDHLDNARLVQKMLQNRFDVELAADGETGLAAWKERQHELVLLDIMLPRMSGSEVLKEFVVLNPALPVVIMTAHATMELARDLMLSGAADFITKPFRAEEIRKVCDLAVRRDDYLVSNAQFADHMDNLQQLQNLLGNIIDSMPSVLIGVDAQEKVMLWNKDAEHVSGLSARDTKGKLLTEVWPECCVIEDIRIAMKGGGVQHRRKVPCHWEDSFRFFNITIYPVQNEEFCRAIIRIDDVTEQLLFEKRIVQSEKMVSLGQLSAGVAHEINNPLAAIVQNTQAVKNRLSADVEPNQRVAEALNLDFSMLRQYLEQRGILRQLDVIQESGIRTAKLLENMLSFTHEGSSQKYPHNLADLLERAIDLATAHFSLQRKFDFRQVEIMRDYAPGLSFVKCDPAQIQQVFYNLLLNGADVMEEKYRLQESSSETPSYQPRFLVRVLDKENFVRVEIEDNGPGMTEVAQKHIFEPFFATKDSGSGLGLSISYFIVTKNHDGHIGVESKLGVGTTFYVELPKI
ncbi:Signal transduction histidine kinase, nitrogen specific [Desulfuromusa kysingii]|uniref:histidine kinase n=1 Tax=Desulfuromusa kysingii TaxID=37625 RepID=A0A1H3YKT8_9BACT|nr:response regulator [Desulfuromusa kysingii]SEA11588.1 Signal transduction histidine kinase, nitrogen specific [Desulfuromusa kysingii]